MKAVTAAEIRRIDQEASRLFGIPSLLLMENAGLQTVRIMESTFPRLARLKVTVVCGHGNNGGDGFVVARHLKNRGGSVSVVLLASKDRPQGDARTNLTILEKMGIPIWECPSSAEFLKLDSLFQETELIVDAILGTGISPPVTGIHEQVISVLSRMGKPIVAIDIPSGLSSDHGEMEGAAMVADLTVTFGLPKIGQFLFPAANQIGKLAVAGIGYPAVLIQEGNLGVELIDDSAVRPLLAPRALSSHKGTFGHVLVVAGARGKSGAAALSALGALRIGAGLVTLGIPGSLLEAMAAKLTEVMILPLSENAQGAPAEAAAGTVLDFLQGKDVLVLGPGIGTSKDTGRLVSTIVKNSQVPIVIDADGLNCIAENPEVLRQSQVPIVMTPHPGEMSRLSGKTTAEVQSHRLEVVREIASTYGVTAVLKGAHTVIAEPSGALAINLSGNQGMATGGSGDVLTGIIGGLLAQGLNPGNAARAAVYLHGLAGDLVAQARGQIGMIAGDLLEELPRTLRLVMEEPFPEALRRVSYYP